MNPLESHETSSAPSSSFLPYLGPDSSNYATKSSNPSSSPMKLHLLIVLLLCAILGPFQSQAFGGDITLSIDATTSLATKTDNDSTDLANVALTITNKGDETAQKISITAQLSDSTQTVSIAEKILPSNSVDAAFTMPIPPGLNGTYPLLLQMRYQHPNGQNATSALLAVLRTSEVEAPPPLSVALEQQQSGGKISLVARVTTTDLSLKDIKLTCFAPEDLTVEQSRQALNFDNGNGLTTFSIISNKGTPGRYAVYVVAETEINGRHELVSSSIVVPIIPQKTLLDRFSRKTWQMAGYGAIILAVLFGVVPVLSRKRITLPSSSHDRATRLIDTAILTACGLFTILNLNPQYLLTHTITTGGDTASHYYTLDYLRHVLLPQGKVSGWTMGNYAGFPLLQFYFPLPFLLMCLLNTVIPLQVAFKVVSLLGTILLPISAYLLLRGLKRPFPAPILGALFTLPFLFHSANSMWGGNILSTLAGEFSYSLSISLSLILLGSLYYGARHERWVVGNAMLVFLVGFSHGYTLLFVEAMSIFFLFTDDGFIRRLIYLAKVYALGFLFLAFWLVPLLVFTRLTTSYHLVWVINSWKEIFPPQILPFALLASVGSIAILTYCLFKRRDNEILTTLAYLWFGLIMSVVFFIAAPKLGVVDIRYVPYGQLLVCLLSALFLGWLARLLPKNSLLWTSPVICMLGIFLWVGGNLGPAPGWSKWNYEGFEAKPSWPIFARINAALKGGLNAPRVVFEHSEEHNTFGSSRAFESLPLFSGRATLEGLYMQASISAPFVFYLQSEVSAVNSAPFPQYTYANMNFKQALPHLRLFNVGDLVIRSDGAKLAIRKVDGYRLKETVGDYELWEVTANTGRYVEPLAFEPILSPTDHWKAKSYRWFMDENQLDVHLVFSDDQQIGPTQQFKAAAHDGTSLQRIPVDSANCQVQEDVGNNEIQITTNCIGKPLLVKVSYHPNWQVEGADHIYLASPSFMLIYPTQSSVRLYYGRGWPDRLGVILSIMSLIILLLNLPIIGANRKTAWSLVARHLHINPSLIPNFDLNLSARTRKKTLVTAIIACSLAVGWFCYHIYTSDINRLFNQAVTDKDAKQYDKAINSFRTIATAQPFSNLAQDSYYYIAICYYLGNKNIEAIAAFKKLINDYPKSLHVPEAYFHIALCQFRLGQQAEGNSTMNHIVHDYPGSKWAKYASEQLSEETRTAGAESKDVPASTGDQQLSKAIGLFNHNQLPAAKIEFEQLIARFTDHPGIPQALACLALIAYKQGDCNGTIQRYREMLDRYPQNPLAPEAYFHIGLCLDRLGRREEARESLQSAASDYPATVYGRQSADKLKGW